MRIPQRILTLLFVVTTGCVFAQPSLDLTDPVAHYNKGLDLYDKEKFVAAASEFASYLEEGKEHQLRVLSEYYIAFCSVKLSQKDAEEKTEKVLEDYPGHPKANSARFLLGSYYFDKHNIGRCLQYMEEVNVGSLLVDEQKEYYFALGYCYFQRDQYDKSRDNLKVIQLNKDKYYYPSNYYLGYMAMQDGNDEEALKHFRRIVKSKVYGDKAPLYISKILYRQKKYQELLDYTDSLKSNPEMEDINWERGKAYFQLGKYKEAQNNFKEGRGTRDLLPQDHYMIGMTAFHLEQYEEAYVDLTAIRATDHLLRQSALMHAGISFLKVDKKTNARNAFYEASRLDTDPEMAELALFNYAKLALEPPFQNEAVGNLSHFLETYPNSKYADEARGYLGEALLNARRYSDAIPVLEGIKKKDAKIRRVYQEICYYYANELLREAPEQALIYFEKARKYPEDAKINAMVDFWTGEIQYENGDLKSAQKYWEAFLRNDAAEETEVYHDGIYNLAYAYFKQREYGKASVQFEKYRKLETYSGSKVNKYIDGVTRLADCYFVEKRYDAAADAYAYVTSKDAVNSDYAYFQIGMIKGLQGKVEEKVVTMKRIPSKYPNSEYTDDAIFEIASERMGQKAYSLAINGFSYLIEEFPFGVYAKKSYLNRALAHQQLKDFDKALYDYKKVVAMRPSDKDSRSALEMIKTIYTDQGRAQELIDYLKNDANEKISASYQDSLLFNSAMVHYKALECDKSIQHFSNYLQEFPSGYFNTEARFYRSECYFKANDYDKALNGYLYAIQKKYPDFMEVAHLKAAYIYLKQDKTDLALPILEELELIASKKENIIYAQSNLMYGYAKQGDYEKARKVAKRVLDNKKAQASEIRDAKMIIGTALMKEAKWEEARKYFFEVDQGKNKNAKGAEAKYNLALIDFKTNNLKDAVNQVYELDEKYPNQVYWVAKAYLLLSEVYIKQKDLLNARAVINSILDNYKVQDDGILEEAKRLLKQAEESPKPENQGNSEPKKKPDGD